MARARTFASLVALSAIIVPLSAHAQFGTIFGEPPPRPPSDVPGRPPPQYGRPSDYPQQAYPQQQQYPQQQYPQQQYPQQQYPQQGYPQQQYPQQGYPQQQGPPPLA